MNEDVEKSLAEAVDWYAKKEEERKTRFFVQMTWNNTQAVSVECN